MAMKSTLGRRVSCDQAVLGAQRSSGSPSAITAVNAHQRWPTVEKGNAMNACLALAPVALLTVTRLPTNSHQMDEDYGFVTFHSENVA